MHRDPVTHHPIRLPRRDFVRRISMAAAGAGAAALAGCQSSDSQEPTKTASLAPPQPPPSMAPQEKAERTTAAVGKLPRVRLGDRMGNMEVSRIVMSQDWDGSLYAPALALGANFVHKAGYWGDLPPEFKNLDRDSYYTDITVDSTPGNPDDEDGAYNQVVQSLSRNGLKYYDIFRAHYGWQSVDLFKNKTGTYRAFQRLKREGKVKYFGVSQHPYVPYPEIIQAEIDSGIIDSMQVWFSASTKPEELEVFAKAHKAGIGMTAMKTFDQGHGAMQGNPQLQQQLKADGKIGRACVRYALSATHAGTGSEPVFHCCVSSLHDIETFEENMGAVGARVAMADGFILNV